MIEIPSLRPETRYGIPPADHMLFNREYIVGYSYLFRQARWVMEMIDPTNRADVDRDGGFREDMRIPDRFRAKLEDYKGSGFDRGHLVSSADRRATRLENSETFLLTNMSPQKPKFNQRIWKELESAVRDLSFLFLEVYVVCGPVFMIDKEIKVVGKSNSKKKNDVVVPIPHGYFKSILAESTKNRLKMWSFILPNEEVPVPKGATPAQLGDIFSKFLVPTLELEMKTGLPLWDRLRGDRADSLRSRKNKIWSLAQAKSVADKVRAEREKEDKAKEKLLKQAIDD